MSKKLLVAALLPWAAYAQNSSEPTSITIYNRVEQPLTSALAPVEVITKADIERRQPRSLVDLLETLPGMQFGSQNGGIGQSSSLFVRGTESAHVLVLMNGRPLAQMVSSNVDFSQLPVSNVERIEYIRGSRAAIYGSKAIGGVVNIITTSQVNSAQVGVTTGSNDYYAADVSINQWVTEATRLQLTTGYRETRGYDVIPDNSEPDRDGFDSKNLTIGVEHQLNQSWTLDGNVNGWENHTTYDGFFGDASETKAYQADAGLKYQGQNLVGQLNASYGEFAAENWKESSGKETASNISTAFTRLDGLTQYTYSKQGYILAGMDWQRDRLLAKSTNYSAPDRDNTGVYASIFHIWSPVSIELTGRVDDNEQFGTHSTWQSSLAAELSEQNKAILSFGTAFRAPNFIELNFLSGEPKPEKSENLELSLTGDYSLFDWQLNLYRNDIKGLLFNQTPTQKDNTDVVIEGVEVVVKASTGLVRHTASYEYTNAEDQRAPNQGKQLLNRAKRKFSWTGDIDIANANLFAQVLYVGERETPDANTFARTLTPSYTIWNVGARYPLTSNLTLNGKVNNLLDKGYQVVSGYDAPDMEFYVGADYRF
jgi:vitamin B12 transporter